MFVPAMLTPSAFQRLLAAATAALAGAAALALGAPAAFALDCPGAQPACPYTASSQIGQRGGGVLRFPQTVAIGPDRNVYVGDQSSSVVQVFDPLGSFLREVGRAGVRPGELRSVGAIAVAADNTLFVAEGTNRIDRFDAAGNLVQSFGKGGNGVGEFHFGAGGGNDAPAGGGLAVSGNLLFVSDSFNDRIQRFNLDGSGGAEIVAPATLAYPRGLTVDGQRLLVADDKHHRIAVFDIGGRPLTTFGSGPGAGPGQLNFPFGVAVDPAGRVFVADDLNHRVVRFGPKSSYPYKARWGHYGTEPGGLAYPRAIAVDPGGSLYVTNTGNDRIDVFDRSGGLLRSFGASGRANGQFNTPLGGGGGAPGRRVQPPPRRRRRRLRDPRRDGLRQRARPAAEPRRLDRDRMGIGCARHTQNNHVQQFALAAPPAGGCAALGPLGNPPPPRLPTLPLPLGPQLSVRVLRSDGLFTSRVLALRVGCDTVCTVTATGTVTERSKPRKRKRAVSATFGPVTAKLPAGETKVVRLALSRGQVARLRKAMKQRRGVVVTLQLTAVAAAGEPTAVSRRLTAIG